MKLVIFRDFPDPLHFIVVRFVLHGEFLNGIAFHQIVELAGGEVASRRFVEGKYIPEQSIFFFVYVLNEVFNKKRENDLQVAFNLGVIVVLSFEVFYKPGDVRQLVFDEEEMRMLQVFNDQVNRIGDQREIGLLHMGRTFQFLDNLLDFEATLLTNLRQRLF